MTRSVLIFANCQGEELRTTARYLTCLTGVTDFKWIASHKVTDADWAMRYGPDFMADVAVVWEQVESGQESAHRAALHRGLPKDVQIIRFPPFSALCLWPFSGNDPRQATDPTRYPWPDSIAAVLATEDLPDNAMFERYLEITAQRMPDLERRLRFDLARWRATDAIADIKVADWVERNFRAKRLFYTAGHVTAEPTRFLLNQLLSRTAFIDGALAARAALEIEVLLRYHAGQDFECVPLHPLVAERLALQFHDPNRLYRWHGHEWTLRQYILRYIRWAPYLD